MVFKTINKLNGDVRVGPYSNISRMARDTCVAEGKPREQAERGQSSASQEKMLQIKLILLSP